MSTRLVADLGGTNVRFALYDEANDQLREIRSLGCSAHPSFGDAIAAYLSTVGIEAPGSACFAVAAVETSDRVRMTNNDWCFTHQELMSRFGFQHLKMINDFTAVALSLPRIPRTQLHALTPGLVVDSGDLLAIGPGTGLGGARLVGGNQVVPCEPGHAGLSPGTELELEIFRLLQPQWGEIYSELLVSGPGMRRLYETLASILGESVQALNAAEISAHAMAGTDPLCQQVLEVFCALLGSAAGDFTISSGTYGGVFLAGGIVPRIIPLLEQGHFQQRFVCKGAMEERLREVPLNIVLEQHPGLIGAAAWPLED